MGKKRYVAASILAGLYIAATESVAVIPHVRRARNVAKVVAQFGYRLGGINGEMCGLMAAAANQNVPVGMIRGLISLNRGFRLQEGWRDTPSYAWIEASFFTADEPGFVHGRVKGDRLSVLALHEYVKGARIPGSESQLDEKSQTWLTLSLECPTTHVLYVRRRLDEQAAANKEAAQDADAD